MQEDESETDEEGPGTSSEDAVTQGSFPAARTIISTRVLQDIDSLRDFLAKNATDSSDEDVLSQANICIHGDS